MEKFENPSTFAMFALRSTMQTSSAVRIGLRFKKKCSRSKLKTTIILIMRMMRMITRGTLF